MDRREAMNGNHLRMTTDELERAVALIDAEIPVHERRAQQITDVELPEAIARHGDLLDLATAAGQALVRRLEDGPALNVEWTGTPEGVRQQFLDDDQRRFATTVIGPLQGELAQSRRIADQLRSRRHVLNETLEAKQAEREAVAAMLPPERSGVVERMRQRLRGSPGNTRG